MSRRVRSASSAQSTRAVEAPVSVLAADAEAHLVFSLARTANGDSRLLEVGRIANWPRLLQLASDENALIALRDRVRHGDGSALPCGMERYLALLALDREYRMRVLEDRLEQSLLALNAAGIDVLLLKGGALACTVYGSFAARPMRDIDLLVRPDRAGKARDLMLDLGWTSDPKVPSDRSYRTHHHLPPLRDAGQSGLRLEIHRSLLATGHPFRFTEEEIWRDARTVMVGNGRALAMHPAHHAVHVAIHFAWSHMLKLGAWHAFRDLDALASSSILQWDAFADTASAWGASNCCYWTLRLGLALANLSVPDSVLRRLQPRMPAVIRQALTRHFVNGLARGEAVCPSVRLDQLLWSLAMQPRREGHGRIRPWLVSLELVFELNEKARVSGDEQSSSAFLQMRRSSRYLTGILA